MRHLPDGDFKWILHIIDHWSKFNLAFPLINKGAHNVAEVLEKYVFPIVGLPSILHSDNGREFVNSVIKEILNDWPGQVQLVSGRPRHPQSQGVVEQAHYTLERMLSAKVAEQKSCKPPWSMWLPHIVYTMNTQVHETTKQMPYELVFGQPPRSIIIPDPRLKAMIDEEQLDKKDTVTCKSDDEDKESNHDDSSSVGIIEDLKHNEEEKNEGNGTELEGIAANTEEELPEDAEDSGGFEEIRSESSLPRSLGTKKIHLEIRNKADASYLKSIERMGQKYSKHNGNHIKKFAVGDSVSVRVPRIDRANTDLERLPCIVVEIVGKACSMYRLCCKEGVLKTCYSAGDLELFNASFEFAAEGWRTMPVVSLREAAKLHAPWNTFTKNKCTYLSKCSIICDESDVDVDAQQNGVVSVNAGAPVTQNKCEINFSAHMKKMIEAGDWLTDEHMSLAQEILKHQFSHIDG
ncbi:hypothetical protein EMCRGX_G002158 [Ephydatia muelleri]